MKPTCLICHGVFANKATSLTDGSFVHDACESDLRQKIELLGSLAEKPNKVLIETAQTISRLEGELRELNGTGNVKKIFSSILGFKTSKMEEREQSIKETNQQIESLKEARIEISKQRNLETSGQIEEVYASLKPIYDYWPDYPPDWLRRRDEAHALAKNKCQGCGYKKYPKKRRSRYQRRAFQLHHKLPLSRGGDHTHSNLLLLCEECHQKEHRHDLNPTYAVPTEKDPKTKFSGNMDSIVEAINNKQVICFDYRKQNGSRSHREVLPSEIVLDKFKKNSVV